MPENYLTVTEAATELSVSPRTVQRYCRQGLINHKWVSGKRHKELRIIPPIDTSILPGVRHHRQFDPEDFIPRTHFDSVVADLTARIHELEHALAEAPTMSSDGGSPAASSEVTAFMREFERVRPVEQKLILTMAREIKDHEEFLSTLGMEKTEDE